MGTKRATEELLLREKHRLMSQPFEWWMQFNVPQAYDCELDGRLVEFVIELLDRNDEYIEIGLSINPMAVSGRIWPIIAWQKTAGIRWVMFRDGRIHDPHPPTWVFRWRWGP
jgi:hypothetical protein